VVRGSVASIARAETSRAYDGASYDRAPEVGITTPEGTSKPSRWGVLRENVSSIVSGASGDVSVASTSPKSKWSIIRENISASKGKNTPSYSYLPSRKDRRKSAKAVYQHQLETLSLVYTNYTRLVEVCQDKVYLFFNLLRFYHRTIYKAKSNHIMRNRIKYIMLKALDGWINAYVRLPDYTRHIQGFTDVVTRIRKTYALRYLRFNISRERLRRANFKRYCAVVRQKPLVYKAVLLFYCPVAVAFLDKLIVAMRTEGLSTEEKGASDMYHLRYMQQHSIRKWNKWSTQLKYSRHHSFRYNQVVESEVLGGESNRRIMKHSLKHNTSVTILTALLHRYLIKWRVKSRKCNLYSTYGDYVVSQVSYDPATYTERGRCRALVNRRRTACCIIKQLDDPNGNRLVINNFTFNEYSAIVPTTASYMGARVDSTESDEVNRQSSYNKVLSYAFSKASKSAKLVTRVYYSDSKVPKHRSIKPVPSLVRCDDGSYLASGAMQRVLFGRWYVNYLRDKSIKTHYYSVRAAAQRKVTKDSWAVWKMYYKSTRHYRAELCLSGLTCLRYRMQHRQAAVLSRDMATRYQNHCGLIAFLLCLRTKYSNKLFNVNESIRKYFGILSFHQRSHHFYQLEPVRLPHHSNRKHYTIRVKAAEEIAKLVEFRAAALKFLRRLKRAIHAEKVRGSKIYGVWQQKQRVVLSVLLANVLFKRKFKILCQRYRRHLSRRMRTACVTHRHLFQYRKTYFKTWRTHYIFNKSCHVLLSTVTLKLRCGFDRLHFWTNRLKQSVHAVLALVRRNSKRAMLRHYKYVYRMVTSHRVVSKKRLFILLHRNVRMNWHFKHGNTHKIVTYIPRILLRIHFNRFCAVLNQQRMSRRIVRESDVLNSGYILQNGLKKLMNKLLPSPKPRLNLLNQHIRRYVVIGDSGDHEKSMSIGTDVVRAVPLTPSIIRVPAVTLPYKRSKSSFLLTMLISRAKKRLESIKLAHLVSQWIDNYRYTREIDRRGDQQHRLYSCKKYIQLLHQHSAQSKLSRYLRHRASCMYVLKRYELHVYSRLIAKKMVKTSALYYTAQLSRRAVQTWYYRTKILQKMKRKNKLSKKFYRNRNSSLVMLLWQAHCI
jgi:hypothetical protein